MNEARMNSSFETDWSRVDAMTDAEIDTSDIPPLSDSFFRRARVRMPKQGITVQVDEDVLNWFKAQGGDYAQRMNVALRIYADAHRTA